MFHVKHYRLHTERGMFHVEHFYVYSSAARMIFL